MPGGDPLVALARANEIRHHRAAARRGLGGCGRALGLARLCALLRPNGGDYWSPEVLEATDGWPVRQALCAVDMVGPRRATALLLRAQLAAGVTCGALRTSPLRAARLIGAMERIDETGPLSADLRPLSGRRPLAGAGAAAVRAGALPGTRLPALWVERAGELVVLAYFTSEACMRTYLRHHPEAGEGGDRRGGA